MLSFLLCLVLGNTAHDATEAMQTLATSNAAAKGK